MKGLLAATTLFASHALAWYASGDLCYSNVECNTNCLFSQWTIGGKDSDYMFVCDKTTIDPDQFYLADCQTVTQNESGVEQIEVDDALTISACAASTLVAISASWKAIAWCWAIGLPKVSRCWA